jgi:uncharacterized membrane protein YkoI
VAKSWIIVCLLSLGCGVSLPLHASAQTAETFMQLAQDAAQFPIRPSEAALIAKDANPDSKVLNVKLLPSGVYAVTLKIGGSVARVMVDATTGAIN